MLGKNQLIRLVRVAVLVSGLCACSSMDYYRQSIQGQLEIWQKSEPIHQLLSNKDLPEETRTRLHEVTEIRDFAIAELGLPGNNSYLDYADLGRSYVVWNVFAAPELSLESREWCYFIAGCLAYRGYFSESDAYAHAIKLENQGYDVFVGGVSAYSTLGWFADPVLNTMLYRDTVYLAKVIFHELAHQKLYIKDDTEFNEAFADTVAITGVKLWLEKHGSQEDYEKFMQNQSRENRFVDLVLRYRQQLDRIYQSLLSDEEKREMKNSMFQKMLNEYQVIRSDWGQDTSYDTWFSLGINNAKLMAVTTYRQFVPGFKKLLTVTNGDFKKFYELVTRLGQCDRELRRKILRSQETGFSC